MPMVLITVVMAFGGGVGVKVFILMPVQCVVANPRGPDYTVYFCAAFDNAPESYRLFRSPYTGASFRLDINLDDCANLRIRSILAQCNWVGSCLCRRKHHKWWHYRFRTCRPDRCTIYVSCEEQGLEIKDWCFLDICR